jgi:hypothetical protein
MLACMRMRKLAHGQSVMLCAPPEIHRKIVEHCGKPGANSVDVEDVLLWSISNTHDYTRKCVELWAIQGMRHQKRQIVWHGTKRPDEVLEPEAKSLDGWYRVRESGNNAKWLQTYGGEFINGRPNEVAAIRAKLGDFGTGSIDEALLHEEQERELSPESEQERQLERPPKSKPAKHSVHEDLVRMVNQGRLEPKSLAFVPAFQTLSNTTASNSFKLDEWPHTSNLDTWPNGLLGTKDFAQTIQAAKTEKQNDFIRPIQWVLSCRKSNVLAVISPFEANELQPLIRKQDKIALHVYSPRIRHSMVPLDDLEYCATPSRGPLDPLPEISSRIQLNLFAGQLYFRDREEYLSVCRFLGLATRASEQGMEFSSDAFVPPESRKMFDLEMARVCSMSKSPVEMLRTLVVMRRKGQEFSKTHLGLVLGGERIKDDAFSS